MVRSTDLLVICSGLDSGIGCDGLENKLCRWRYRSQPWGLLSLSCDERPCWPRPVAGDCEQDYNFSDFGYFDVCSWKATRKKNILRRSIITRLLIRFCPLDQGTPCLSELVLHRIGGGVPKQCGHSISGNERPILILGYRKTPPT
jgi:hypothetical protein